MAIKATIDYKFSLFADMPHLLKLFCNQSWISINGEIISNESVIKLLEKRYTDVMVFYKMNKLPLE